MAQSVDPVADVLNRAADVLEQPGVWAQGKDALKRGRGCILTVAARVCGDLSRADRAQIAGQVNARLARALYLVGDASVAILDWNDVPERTAVQVVNALREAARTA